MAYILEDCLSRAVSVLLGHVLQQAKKLTYGFNPAGGSADGGLDIVERHAVFADCWGQ